MKYNFPSGVPTVGEVLPNDVLPLFRPESGVFSVAPALLGGQMTVFSYDGAGIGQSVPLSLPGVPRFAIFLEYIASNWGRVYFWVASRPLEAFLAAGAVYAGWENRVVQFTQTELVLGGREDLCQLSFEYTVVCFS